MKDIRNYTLAEMQGLMKELGQPGFRAKQVYQWIYKGVTEFSQMRNLPKALLEQLSQDFTLNSLTTLRVQESKEDGTKKFLFGLPDGNAVESVYMKYKYGVSVCISSQAGCRMGCAFCASGIDGLARNLTAGEMISQIMNIQEATGEPVSHVVVMGTGEPFDNFAEIQRFVELLHAPEGFGLGMRNITVSTCGLVPKIEEFAEVLPQVNLAISLHAPNDELRSQLMPVNKSYPLDVLIPAVKAYTKKTGRRVTFEYALIHGVNDTDDCVDELTKLVRGMLCHVNLIPLNEVSETGFQTSGRRRALQIAEVLEQRGVPCTVRRQLGADIDGACGQLRLNN